MHRQLIVLRITLVPIFVFHCSVLNRSSVEPILDIIFGYFFQSNAANTNKQLLRQNHKMSHHKKYCKLRYAYQTNIVQK